MKIIMDSNYSRIGIRFPYLLIVHWEFLVSGDIIKRKRLGKNYKGPQDSDIG